MKKDKFLQMARLLLTPLVMVLLGLLLLLRPDSASALVGRVIGWILVVIGGGLVLDSILVRDAMAGRILFAAVTLMGQLGGSAMKLKITPSIWQCSYLIIMAASLNLVLGFLGQLSAPMPKVVRMVWFTLMPISVAASLSSATHRMAQPTLAFWVNRYRATMITAASAPAWACWWSCWPTGPSVRPAIT